MIRERQPLLAKLETTCFADYQCSLHSVRMTLQSVSPEGSSAGNPANFLRGVWIESAGIKVERQELFCREAPLQGSETRETGDR